MFIWVAAHRGRLSVAIIRNRSLYHIVRSQSIWILFGAGRSQYFYFFISGTGHKGQICNLQWFLAKCCCFHLQFSSDSEHMDHVSWIVLNPFKMLFSSPHVSLIVLCCLMSDPSGKTTIIHGHYFHKSRKKQTHQLYYWLRKASWQQEIGENMMRGGHHSLSGLLSGQDQNWFKIEDKYFGNIEKLQPAQVHSKFQASSGSRVVFQMFWTVQVSTVVIQMKCGHPCDSDDRDPCFGAACLFELPWVSEGIPPCLNGPTDHWPQPTPFYPWTQITKHFSHPRRLKGNFDAMLRIRDGGGGRRWSHLSPILTSLFGNWGLPRPRIHAWPKHRRYSRHTTRKPGSFLDCDLVSGGARWRKA